MNESLAAQGRFQKFWIGKYPPTPLPPPPGRCKGGEKSPTQEKEAQKVD